MFGERPAKQTQLTRGVPCRPLQALRGTWKRSRVAGDLRIEIAGVPADQIEWLKTIGCFTEIIAYRTRIFVPADNPEPVVRALLAPL